MKDFCFGAWTSGAVIVFVFTTIGMDRPAMAMLAWTAANMVGWGVCMITDAIKEGK